jgi:SynChlorMet cassette radical SAM/SPASM protein ScmF
MPPLTQLYVYLTEGCNLACRHCWLAPKLDPDASRYPVLAVELFDSAVRQAAPLGLERVKLTGGEPLLHPAIKRLIGIVRDNGLALTIETNGMLMDRGVAEEIARCERRSVAVSLDGVDAVTHDAIRGVSGAHEGAIAAIRHLVDTGTRPQIIMSVMRSNAEQVEAMAELGASLGVNSVKYNVVQPTERGRAVHDSNAGLTVEEYITLGRKVDSELVGKARVELFFDYPQAFRPMSRIASGAGCTRCSIKSVLGLLANGRYALCGIGEHVEALVFGAVLEDSLADVWREHPVLMSIRDGLPGRLGGVCSRCVMKESCLGSCVAQNFYRAQSLWAPFWFCEEAEARGLFPSSRSVVLEYNIPTRRKRDVQGDEAR